MATYGPDFNLGFDPAAHHSFTVPDGYQARVSIWGDGAIEQGLMLYTVDSVAIAIMRTHPGVDDARGGLLRRGEELLGPGKYILGGYSKFEGHWASSRARVWEASPEKLTIGFDDTGDHRGDAGLLQPDRDFNDAMITFEFHRVDPQEDLTSPVSTS